MSIVGQCAVDPVTGISGDIYNAWTGDTGSGIDSRVLVTGSAPRARIAAQIVAIATSILSGPSTLPGTWLVSSKAADFTAAVWTRYAVDTTSSDVTATLPAASTCAGKGIFFKKIAAAHNMIVASTDLIDGSAALTYTALWSPLTLYSTGATWYTA